MRETCTHAEGRHACNIFDCPDNRRRWGNRESSCRSVAPEGHHWLRSCGILIRRNRIRRSCCRSSRWRIRSWWRANRLRAFPVPKWNLFKKKSQYFFIDLASNKHTIHYRGTRAWNRWSCIRKSSTCTLQDNRNRRNIDWCTFEGSWERLRGKFQDGCSRNVRLGSRILRNWNLRPNISFRI